MQFRYNIYFRSISLCVALLLSLFIIGCSSSGSDGDDNGLRPTANAGEDQEVFENQVVRLSATKSVDTDGTIQAYQWQQTRGPSVSITGADNVDATFISPSVSADSLMSFELTVTDEAGLFNKDEINVVVLDNDLPVSDAGPDQQVLESQVVALDGTQSQDNDGSIVTYLWSQVGGISVTDDPSFDTSSPTPTFTAPATGGKLSFQLTVSDNLGAEGTDQVDIYINSILFGDDFSQGLNETSWIKVDDSAGSGNNSAWTVSGDALEQENYVASITQGTAFDQSYHKGAYRYLNTSVGLADYRFQVEITPLTNGYGGDGNDIGIMFRYQSQNNYYRLSMSSRYGFTRLEKKVDGEFSALAVNSIGYFDDVPTEFAIDVKGSLIQVFIDNEPFFSVVDSDLTFGTVALYCQDKVRFDDAYITNANMAPRVVISTPGAYMVDTTDTSDLNVSAHVANLPDDAWVEFLLNDSVVISDMEAPFEVQFSGVTSGEQEVTAVLKDVDGNELDRDLNQTVGIGGGYYVTAGDSITNGSGDTFSIDNVSNDGRTVSFQGYAATLNNKLTEHLNLPQIVFNEGIPGATTASYQSAIDSVLARYQKNETVLLLLGTNDVGSLSANDYSTNMQSLVNTINAAGMTARVATVPPQFQAGTGQPNNAINGLIEVYNDEIAALTNTQEGPDLFSFFIDNDGLFADSLHPNSLGHASIAKLWQNKLTGTNDSPFILKQFQAPALYQQNLLEEGDVFYIDESDTLTYVPQVIASGIWIMTADGDYSNTTASFISFELDRAATVYVAYDGRNGVTLPGWLSGSFTDTGLQINSTAGVFNLYSRLYNTGTVTLGGNNANGGTGQLNYLVVVKE